MEMMYGKKWGKENWIKARKGYEPEKAQTCLQIDSIRDNCSPLGTSKVISYNIP